MELPGNILNKTYQRTFLMFKHGRKFWRTELDEILNSEKIYDTNHINCYLDQNKNTSKTVCSYIYKSYQLTNVLDADNINESFTLPKGVGFIYSRNVSYKMLKLYNERKINYIYMDNSYFSKFYDDKTSRFRLTVNDIHPRKMFREPVEDKHGIVLAQWKKRDDRHLYILLCPPTGNVLSLFGINDKWIYKTIKAIRSETDRKILVRFKSMDYVNKDITAFFNKLNKKFGNISFDEKFTKKSLLSLFPDCYAVVAPASGVGVIAATHGIPVFSENFGPVASISVHNYSQINYPRYPDRQDWLNMHLNHEFTLHDFHSGAWISRLKKIYPNELKKILDEKTNILHG